MIQRIADYTASHWHETDNGIWELRWRKHFVSSKVMSWVVLDRAIKIAEKVNRSFDTRRWRHVKSMIHREVLRRGWSTRLRAFRQHYEGDNLDSAALLIPIMGFLPAKDARVLATVERLEQLLTIDGFVYRFAPQQTPGIGKLPLGEMEGAFLPCTFWMATVHAQTGFRKTAETILDQVENIAGKLRLFAEAVDPRTRGFLGNSPLLFSHVEYIRAVLALNRGKRA